MIRKVEQTMKKTIFEEMGGTYIRHGDYLIPALTLPKDVGRILRTFKIKKNVEVTDNGKIII